MIASNDDAPTTAERRRLIYEEMRNRGGVQMAPAELATWTSQASATLTVWAVEDGLALEAIKTGSVPEPSGIVLQFWRMIDAVARSHSPEGRQLVNDGITEFERLQFYDLAAATRGMKRLLEDGVAAAGLTGLHAAVVVAQLQIQVMNAIDSRLRAKLEQLREEAGPTE